MTEQTLTQADVEAIAEAVARRLGPQSEWLTVADVAELLGYTAATVRRLPLPVHAYGRNRRYKRSEIEAWLAGHRKSA